MPPLRAVPVALLLLSCGPEPPVLASAEFEVALTQMREKRSAPQKWLELADRIDALEPEREELRAVELDMLVSAASEAMARGAPADAAPPLQAGLKLAPEHPELGRLRAQLASAATTAAPSEREEIAGLLTELDPAERDRWEDVRAGAAVAQRYAEERWPVTREGWEGVTVSAAHAILERLDAEYVIDPPWERIASAGAGRLAQVSEDAGVQERWPGASALSVPQAAPKDLRRLQDALSAAVSAGGDAGLPAELVIAEWMDAGLAALDPWTRAVWPAEIASWRAHHEGVRLGVGLELSTDAQGRVRVSRPLPDSPAWTSGLHQGDQIVKISDDARTLLLESLPADAREAAAAAHLTGTVGSRVEITARRDAENVFAVTLTRGPVVLETVQGFERGDDNAWSPLLDPAVAYVRITGFRARSEADFDALTEPIAAPGLGVILDLRGNPGGDVNAAVQIADRFIADGILADLEGRVEPETSGDTSAELIPWNHAVEGHALEDARVVVIVDEDTASAAEILAGSLQERVGAVVIGEPTWGKGLAQAIRSEPERGYAVQYTNQVWTLPSGRRLSRDLDGGGVQPDVAESLGPAARFQVGLMARQRAALRVHADGVPMHGVETVARSDLPPLSADPLLLRAELILRVLQAPPQQRGCGTVGAGIVP